MGVTLADRSEYLCEVQLNLVQMLDAKAEAHEPYAVIRSKLPAICLEACGGDAKAAKELESFIEGRLNNSALDGPVAAIAAKAGGLFLYAYLLTKHLESEAKAGRRIDVTGIDTLPAGLADVYEVNLKRAFPAGAADLKWKEARPLIELIAAAREPITVEMAEALLSWDAATKTRVLNASALLFPVREGRFHVFHKTIVDYITGDVSEGSSVTERSAVFRVERRNGHAAFAAGFLAWLATRDEAFTTYWLQHGVVHLCRAPGKAERAAHVYATSLPLLTQRVDAKLLSVVVTDYLELRCASGVSLEAPTAMKRFVGKYRDVLEREGGAAVAQLASQQPATSIVFQALQEKAVAHETRMVVWRNKPKKADACIATLAHKSEVKALAISKTHIVCGAGNSLFVYDFETEQLLQELEGDSEVASAAITEKCGKDGKGWIAAGYKNGTLKVWDSGEPLNGNPIGPRLASDALFARLAASLELKTEKQNAHSDNINSVDFSPDGSKIVSCSDDKTLKVWDSGAHM